MIQGTFLNLRAFGRSGNKPIIPEEQGGGNMHPAGSPFGCERGSRA